MRPSNKGFTLIELLVVIVIIAVLAAILFPVFASAKLKGLQANCAGNMKQLAVAANAYFGDYGTLSGVNSVRVDSEWPFVERKVDASSGVTGFVAGDARRVAVAKYIRNAGIMVCPAEKGKILVYGDIGHGVVIDRNTQGRLTYAWHYTWNDGCPDIPDSVTRPAKMPTWVEENTDFSIKKDDGMPNFLNDNRFVNTDITSSRHSGFCNVSFLDGHVQSMKGGLVQASAKWPGTEQLIFRDPKIKN